MTSLGDQVREHILQQIKAGELKLGDRLPPEVTLATTLGVSRSTIRLAFADLEKKGVLLRRKRTGTQIIAERPQQRFSMATQGIQELLSLGRDTRLDISSVTHVSADEVPQWQNDDTANEAWLLVQGTRTLPGDVLPFSVNRVYVPPRYSAIETVLTKHETSIFQVIETLFSVHVARVTQTTQAVICPVDDGEIMGLAASSAALRIQADLYAHDDTLLERSLAIFDPERFQIQTDVMIDGRGSPGF